MKKPVLIVILGPTAVGKTALAIELAKIWQTAIVSADSRQFFKEMTIGTAKPDELQLAEAPHYFINNKSIDSVYSVGEFEREVIAFLEEYFLHHSVAIMAGGSGLYLDAVTNGLDNLPQVAEELRSEVRKLYLEQGLTPLLEELKLADPVYYKDADKNNPQRIIRAVEVCRSSGLPFSSFFNQKEIKRSFEVIKIGIETDRTMLYDTINRRVDLMMQMGLLDEVRTLVPQKNLNALQTVGYKELFDYLEGCTTLEEAVELIKRNTRRYAKRQLTWFRKDSSIVWFGNKELEKIRSYLEMQIAPL